MELATETAVYTVSGIFFSPNSLKMSQLYGCRHFEVVLLIYIYYFFVIFTLSFSQESL